MMVWLAKIFVSKKEVTEKEIELWIKHLGPVWKKNMNWMKQALENWYKEMREYDLTPESTNKIDFIDFIKGNIKNK